jgi:hypothetical protein
MKTNHFSNRFRGIEVENESFFSSHSKSLRKIQIEELKYFGWVFENCFPFLYCNLLGIQKN